MYSRDFSSYTPPANYHGIVFASEEETAAPNPQENATSGQGAELHTEAENAAPREESCETDERSGGTAPADQAIPASAHGEKAKQGTPFLGNLSLSSDELFLLVALWLLWGERGSDHRLLALLVCLLGF